MQSTPQQKYPPHLVASRSTEGISPADLDELLESGWFRYATQLSSDCMRLMETEVCPCVMLRIPLSGFVWKKRLLKLKRRNEALFRHKVQPFRMSEEKDALWQRFKTEVHGWKFVPNLQTHLCRQQSPDHFPLWEVAVYEGERLVALSLFDHGERNLAALEAAYLPDYKRHSLGIYTMLLELEHAIGLGMDAYYPGFYPKGQPMFDYKLRTGGAQFFSQRLHRWQDWEQFSEVEWVGGIFLLRLAQMKQKMWALGLQTVSAFLYFEQHEPGDKPGIFDSPLLLAWRSNLPPTSNLHFMASWDLHSDTWRLFLGVLYLGVLTHQQDKALTEVICMAAKMSDVQLLGIFEQEDKMVEVARRLKMAITADG